ncbi:nitric oxide-associated protein 1 [Antennarius striatus]|uniref:nitric oxide-associated protein 1 n=1 Tax=Antennarius striatus TaxID=241820 RepID=UPI0035B1F203
MFRVLQVRVHRALVRRVCFPARRVPAAGCAGSLPASKAAAGRSLTRTVRSCTVDPNVEEQFVFPDYTDLEDEDSSSSSFAPPEAEQEAPPRNIKPLGKQLHVLRGVAKQEAEPDSLLEVHDVDFPLDESVIAGRKKKKKKEQKIFGTPDEAQPISDTSCSGCGAILHCTAPDVPGYLPSEKYKVLLGAELLHEATCQRCYLLRHHQRALSVTMTADEYCDVVRRLRPLSALVLLIVDLLDVPHSIVPDLPRLVGTNKHIVVLGNKIDLFPGDAPNYLQRIRRQLLQYCQDAGLGGQVTDVHLISAKTGYGVEGMISSLQRSWKYKGDVYLVGGANAGKSTLFNALLESDYCKSKASDVVQKATTSPWPGTTLNLLKFPIINPTPYRMFRRHERLSKTEEVETTQEELKRVRRFSREGYLMGRVGRTFRTGSKPNEIQFDPDSLALGEDEDGHMEKAPRRSPEAFDLNELKDAHWLFDTPGIMKENDILSLLTDQEVKLVVPSRAIVPRTFVLKPGCSLFVGGLARIDYLEGQKACWFSVVASNQVPVHVTSLERADGVYEKHAGHVLLGVPLGGSERMKDFPPLVPQEFSLTGRCYPEAAADVKLSSAGWVAVTPVAGYQVTLRVHGPAAAAFTLRTPPLLPNIVNLKGDRIGKTSAYRPVKASGVMKGAPKAPGANKPLAKRT